MPAGLLSTGSSGAPTQIVLNCCADSSGLSQLIVLVLKKSPDGAIWATELIVHEHRFEIRLEAELIS